MERETKELSLEFDSWGDLQLWFERHTPPHRYILSVHGDGTITLEPDETERLKRMLVRSDNDI